VACEARATNSEHTVAGGKFRTVSKCSCHSFKISSDDEEAEPSVSLTRAGSDRPPLPLRLLNLDGA